MRCRLSRLSRLHVRNGMGCAFEGRSSFLEGSGSSFIVFSFMPCFRYLVLSPSPFLFLSLTFSSLPSPYLYSAQPN